MQHCGKLWECRHLIKEGELMRLITFEATLFGLTLWMETLTHDGRTALSSCSCIIAAIHSWEISQIRPMHYINQCSLFVLFIVFLEYLMMNNTWYIPAEVSCPFRLGGYVPQQIFYIWIFLFISLLLFFMICNYDNLMLGVKCIFLITVRHRS